MGRVPRSAVLGHAETLLAAMRHLITNESCGAHFLRPGSRHRDQLHAVRRNNDQREKIALIVKRRQAGRSDCERECCRAARCGGRTTKRAAHRKIKHLQLIAETPFRHAESAAVAVGATRARSWDLLTKRHLQGALVQRAFRHVHVPSSTEITTEFSFVGIQGCRAFGWRPPSSLANPSSQLRGPQQACRRDLSRKNCENEGPFPEPCILPAVEPKLLEARAVCPG